MSFNSEGLSAISYIFRMPATNKVWQNNFDINFVAFI